MKNSIKESDEVRQATNNDKNGRMINVKLTLEITKNGIVILNYSSAPKDWAIGFFFFYIVCGFMYFNGLIIGLNIPNKNKLKVLMKLCR